MRVKTSTSGSRHQHTYEADLIWIGAEKGALIDYESYSREYEVRAGTKSPLRGSADAIFRGDAALYNPEELLVAALSACHMLSYLAECARSGIEVFSYEDRASGTMGWREGAMRFTGVVLRPVVKIAGDLERAQALHGRAHELCFIANSVNFPVRHEAQIIVTGEPPSQRSGQRA
ncbi:MAG: OsmC family protein [Vulcanimicrobiaceae bacterium]